MTTIDHSKFRVAQQLSNTAANLDTLKLEWPDVDHDALLALAEQMYDVADELAGNRAHELPHASCEHEEETHL